MGAVREGGGLVGLLAGQRVRHAWDARQVLQMVVVDDGREADVGGLQGAAAGRGILEGESLRGG